MNLIEKYLGEAKSLGILGNNAGTSAQKFKIKQEKDGKFYIIGDIGKKFWEPVIKTGFDSRVKAQKRLDKELMLIKKSK